MNDQRRKELHKINYHATEIGALYHQSSLKLGISDSISIVMYNIYDEGGSCLLSDVYKKSGINKQTVNSAIRTLEADGILFLEQHSGKSKRIVLTEKGKDYMEQTAGRLYEAETRAFDSWTSVEIGEFLRLLEKFTECFRLEIDKM